MTGKERVRAAMTGGSPDRVPYMCQLAVAHAYRALPMTDWCALWLDPERFAGVSEALCRKYGMDGVLINIYPSRKIWRDIRRIERSPERDVVTFADRSRAVFTAGGDEIYDWKLPENKPDPDSFDPDRLEFPSVTQDWYDSLHAFEPEFVRTHSIHWEVQSPFDSLVDLFGLSGALILTLADPDKARAILEKALELQIARGAGALAQAVRPDAVKVSSPYVGQSFLSPEAYRRLVIPYERRLVAALHAADPEAPVYLHTCGALADRLELALESGYDGIECLDPPPLGNVRLEEAAARLSGRAWIKGNLDSVNLLTPGCRPSIEAEVRRCLEIGMAHRPGYILSTACSTAPTVAPETMIFIRGLVEKHGWYR
jgi:uroporphyrinogen-III decarboxylase